MNLYGTTGQHVGYVAWNYVCLFGHHFDITASHKVEQLLERVYHTNHDLMIVCDIQPGRKDIRLVYGDYATAKAKLHKGLSASCFVQIREIYEEEQSDGDAYRSTEIRCVVSDVGYIKEEHNGEVTAEFLMIYNPNWLIVTPDNTAEIL